MWKNATSCQAGASHGAGIGRKLNVRLVLKLVSVLLLAMGTARFAGSQDSAEPATFPAGADILQGTVTGVEGGTYQVKTEGGATWKVFTGVNTFFRKQRDPIKPADIHIGDAIVAGGEVDQKAKTVGAVFLAVIDPAQAKEIEQRRADFGKTWLAGKVTAINDLKITIERPDKKAATIAVDENTSFRKRHDSITLLDIKPGDRVYARGALQNGLFMASILTVVDPNQRRGDPAARP
ncbi:hypothetical protein C7378_2228 [Acidipila rosea]|uniref:DUF5666 domain-containing protein n=1 Tax=Acidipila rosea TaxID=768535 RepID=A0A4R1L3N1_9BACT|nr:hypothetical protein C7378_2228 [Acidipila rosea]